MTNSQALTIMRDYMVKHWETCEDWGPRSTDRNGNVCMIVHLTQLTIRTRDPFPELLHVDHPFLHILKEKGRDACLALINNYIAESEAIEHKELVTV